jgi:predicted MFS family arabinose efflux permease
MALGSIKIVITLAALSLGATLFDIGLIIAGNATVTIVASIGWGRLSDYFGLRVRFLVIFFLASAPLFVLLGLANAVWQLIALFTVFAVSTAGIQPIAAMYAVESKEGKNWQKEIVKYNSYWNTGVIAGLVVNSLLALVMPLSWLLYIASGFCLVSALIVWRTAKEPDLPLEREAYAIINVQDEEQPTTMSVLEYFDIRKIPRGLRRLKPVHLLFIACLIHWTGVFSYTVGEVPFMAAIGMSASLILSVNVAENVATVISFSNVVPRVRMEYQKLVASMIGIRSLIILGWAGLTVFLVYRAPFAFIFPFIFLAIFLVCYALIWYPIMCFAISQAQYNRKGTTQGELLAVISLASVLGSLIGGFVIGTFGFAVGFAVSAGIAVLALPILHYINIEIKPD